MSNSGNCRRRLIGTRCILIALGCLLMLPWLGGCSSMTMISLPEDSQSFLKSVETAPDSVALEIFQVRYPATDAELDAQLWQAVDEQRLDVGVRRELIRNGFRAGVLGGAMPDSLARHLKLKGKLPEQSAEELITRDSADPTVTRRVLQLRRNRPATIQAAREVRANLNVLVNEEGGLCGQSFEQVQPVYSMRAKAVVGQRVALRLMPELQHGELRNRLTGGDTGKFVYTTSREREMYDALEMSVELTAGEILVVGCVVDATGSLGHAFHAESERGPLELKLILVRLLEVPGSEILESPDF